LEEIRGRVIIRNTVRGDWPIWHTTIVEPGVYDAYCNKYGAVSVMAQNGHLLGVKPSEFEWLNPKPVFDEWGNK